MPINLKVFGINLLSYDKWVSYDECAQCPGPECVLYLDDNYKSFLRMRHKVLTVDKIKMLIYVDIRAHLLSKYVRR